LGLEKLLHRASFAQFAPLEAIDAIVTDAIDAGVAHGPRISPPFCDHRVRRGR